MSMRSWATVSTSTTLAHTNAGLICSLTDAHNTELGRNMRDFTMERIVGSINISAPAGSSAYDSATVFLGIATVENDAVAAGAYPDPFGDNIPWLWTLGAQVFVPDNPSASYSTLCVPEHLSSPWLDIRQQRRVKGDQSIVLVGYDDSGITGTLNISANLRTLVTVRV